jgi:hypothetical protein
VAAPAAPKGRSDARSKLRCAAGSHGSRPSACGEKGDPYQPGAPAPPRRPWDSPQYGGKQAEWEAAIQARTQGQNDYVRIPAK